MLEQKQTDQDLSVHVLDSLTFGIAVIDKDGTICAVNDAWRQFSQHNGGAPEATGIGVNYLDVCRSAHGDDSVFAERVRLGIERVLNGSRAVFEIEYPCHSPIRKRWFQLYVSRLMGDSQRAVAAHLPITERKLIEFQLAESERLAAVGQAIQGLSHKGRNELQRAQAHIDLLKITIKSDQEALKLVERIELAQRNLLGLYEEVRNYAAPITLNRESCQIAELVKEVGLTFESSLQEKRLDYQFDSPDSTCYVDVIAMRQVFGHLIDNALASGATLVSISLKSDELNGRPAVTVIVSDDGSGVPYQDREKVFDPFYTTNTHGTGLGLAICRRIAAAHGAQIYFGTPCRGGASVYITLPVAPVRKGDG